MDLRIMWMMFLSMILSIIGMCIGSILGGGHAVALLQMLFPFVIVIHSVMYLYGLAGIAVTLATAFVLALNGDSRTRFLVATACIATWACMAYSLDNGYMK